MEKKKQIAYFYNSEFNADDTQVDMDGDIRGKCSAAAVCKNEGQASERGPGSFILGEQSALHGISGLQSAGVIRFGRWLLWFRSDGQSSRCGSGEDASGA